MYVSLGPGKIAAVPTYSIVFPRWISISPGLSQYFEARSGARLTRLTVLSLMMNLPEVVAVSLKDRHPEVPVVSRGEIPLVGPSAISASREHDTHPCGSSGRAVASGSTGSLY